MLSYDVIFKPRLLHSILLRSDWETIGVAEIRPSKKKLKGVSTKQFWGLKGMLCLGGTILLHKAASALPSPSYIRSRSTIKRVARKFGIPYFLESNVNRKSFLEKLERLKPDVIVSFQHQIFRQTLLDLPKIACINCHPADLPKYRGVKPIFWANLNNEKEIGVTVHTMSAKIDSGRIVVQKKFCIPAKSTLVDQYYMAYDLSSDAIVEALKTLANRPDTSEFKKLDDQKTYFKNPSMEDLMTFKANAKSII